eukprot:TRINITY_DN8887_c1_g1_i1.p1 TRINITY_DN8887_c1_g1~~TRINITY_DN8887_c1_g1_i1.p1  ORF type:complete len:127 (+),score=15.34 TRINITY_DN8887_c1_g1_i1:159-539(+)
MAPAPLLLIQDFDCPGKTRCRHDEEEDHNDLSLVRTVSVGAVEGGGFLRIMPHPTTAHPDLCKKPQRMYCVSDSPTLPSSIQSIVTHFTYFDALWRLCWHFGKAQKLQSALLWWFAKLWQSANKVK